MQPAKQETLGGRIRAVLNYRFDNWGTIIGLELLIGIVGLYILVFQTHGMSSVSYLTTALVLGAIFEHGRALAKKRKWAFAVCMAYGVFITVACLWFAIAWMIQSKDWTMIINVGQGLFLAGCGWGLVKESRKMMKQAGQAEQPALLAEGPLNLNSGSAAEEERYDREDDESDEQYLRDSGG